MQDKSKHVEQAIAATTQAAGAAAAANTRGGAGAGGTSSDTATTQITVCFLDGDTLQVSVPVEINEGKEIVNIGTRVTIGFVIIGPLFSL